MHSTTGLKRNRKICIIIAYIVMSVLGTLSANAQPDLKNSLPDLLRQYKTANQESVKAHVALTIGNFYLNNKSFNLYLDSSLYYIQVAAQAYKGVNNKKGVDDAEVLKAKVWLAQKKVAVVQSMAQKATGKLKSMLHLVLGYHFLNKEGSAPADIKMAKNYVNAVKANAVMNHTPSIGLLADILLYKINQETYTDSAICQQNFQAIIKAAQRINNPKLAVRAWLEKCNYFYTVVERDGYLKHAMKFAIAVKDTEAIIYLKKELADINLQLGKLDLSEKQLLEVVDLYRNNGFKNLQFTYNLLTAVYTKKGQHQKAMFYGIATVNCADSTGTDLSLYFFDYTLAMVFGDLGQYEESMNWLNKCLENYGPGSEFDYSLYRNVLADKFYHGQIKNPLKELRQTMKKHPPKASDALFILQLYGDCYTYIKRLDIAERYYRQVTEKLKASSEKDYMYYICLRDVAVFYIKYGFYSKGKPFVKELFDAPPGMHSKTALVELHGLAFKLDSAEGNYISAIRHINAARAIRDSLFNKARLRQTQELQIQFKTAQKDRENLILRNKNSLQKSELEKDSLQKKLIGMGLLGTFIVLGLMIYLYYTKQSSNKQLKKQQGEISNQNRQLNQLLGEKEWLIKEIHHRVKNNLQIISSLLNTQSSYLQNEEAIVAIRDSQNRMQAISIVHQKLYQSDDLVNVPLKTYLEDLVENICNSFQAKTKVHFEFDVAQLYLGTAETVPIGLILNEAITNSIKYAFEETTRPQILIKMDINASGMYSLTIQDNGGGLPYGFDVHNCTSLGMNLMMGLTEQIGGTFTISSNHGTVINIVFPPSVND